MNFKDYFEPVDLPVIHEFNSLKSGDLKSDIEVYFKKDVFPDLEKAKICLIGVPEERNAQNNIGTAQAPDALRSELYKLKTPWKNLHVVDMGNLKQGHSVNDTYAGLRIVMEELLKSDKIIILLGGGQDLTYANYRAYQEQGRIVNLLSIDPEFDLGDDHSEITNKGFLSKIILEQPNALFNYTNLGYQTYYVNQEDITLMDRMYFDIYRLGSVRHKRKKIEPLLRNSDIVSFDVSAIRMIEAPGNANAGPNGFDGFDACQIARYAGLSNKVSSFGVYEYNPQFDVRNQTAKLMAQVIWYFLEGCSQRIDDDPNQSTNNYQKFYVKLTDDNEDFAEELLFYKNIYSGSWWMEIPVTLVDQRTANRKPFLIPCAERDFEKAKENQIPERWFQFYKKMV
ncbi:MAG: formimidoylglutamase [Bacteroidales bacterium]